MPLLKGPTTEFPPNPLVLARIHDPDGKTLFYAISAFRRHNELQFFGFWEAANYTPHRMSRVTQEKLTEKKALCDLKFHPITLEELKKQLLETTA
jgi:hypothetical protein